MVCLIQRHLDVAKRFNLTCCTVSRFSHWVVLVCEETWTVETLRRSISELSTQTVTPSEMLGFTLERSRPADIKYSAKVSTERLAQEYGDCIITCVGTTDKNEDEIFRIGIVSCLSHGLFKVSIFSTLIRITKCCGIIVRTGQSRLLRPSHPTRFARRR